MRSKQFCLLVTVALMSLSAAAQEDVWLPRYDTDNSGVSPATVDLPAILRWKHTIADAEEATAVATLAVGPEMVYAPLGSTIYALDRRTGECLWQREVGAEVYSSPALFDGTLYFGSRDNNLWALNAESGEVEWRYPMDAPVDCAPVIVDGVAYFGSDDNRLMALDLATRKPLWQFQTRGDIKSTPLVYRDVVVVGSQDRHVYCLNKQGRIMWSKSVSERAFFAAPTAERGKVIYGCGKEVIARDLNTGRRIWRFKAADLVTGAPCVLGAMVYVGTRGGALYGIDAGSGRAIWKYPAEGVTDPIISSPVVVGDLIVFRAGPRQVLAVSLQGEHQWSYTLPKPPEKETQTAPTPGGLDIIPGMEDAEAMGEAADWHAEAPPEAGPEEAVGAEEPGERRERTTTEREIIFENEVDPAVAVSDNTLYVIGDDGIVYAFDSLAADNVPPDIAEPLLEVPGKGRTRMNFTPALADEDDFEGRYADEIAVPGTPPIFLSLLVGDEGCGVDPDQVKVTLNGEEVECAYDATEGIVWWIYDPRGAAANLSNGVKALVFEASDWRGNRAAKVVTLTVDNKLPPPAPPKPKRPERPEGGEGMEGFEMMIPEEPPG
jgi:outer membrane protein assembly factor BamB